MLLAGATNLRVLILLHRDFRLQMAEHLVKYCGQLEILDISGCQVRKYAVLCLNLKGVLLRLWIS